MTNCNKRIRRQYIRKAPEQSYGFFQKGQEKSICLVWRRVSGIWIIQNIVDGHLMSFAIGILFTTCFYCPINNPNWEHPYPVTYQIELSKIWRTYSTQFCLLYPKQKRNSRQLHQSSHSEVTFVFNIFDHFQSLQLSQSTYDSEIGLKRFSSKNWIR